MSEKSAEITDADIQALCSAEKFEAATTQILQTYGSQILGFSMNLLRDQTLAEEAFSLFCEDVWRGLPAFRWQSTLRTWLYTLARNAALRLRGSPHRRAERNLALSASPAVAQMAFKVRTQTRPYLRTEVKDEVAALRSRLSEEDQLLLILRVDRRLPWAEIAQIMLEDDAPDQAALKKETARVRKRFQLVKAQLKKAAIETGIL